MPRLVRRRSHKIGLPPATLVPPVDETLEKTRITYMDYDESNFAEREVPSVDEVFPFKESPTVTWINIDGLRDVDALQKLGEHFALHPLVLEDIVSVDQRPKIEDFESYIFIIIRMIGYNKDAREIDSEQVSLILGPNYVISFQERVGDVLNPIRDRIRNAKGRIRRMGPDYLAYALMDTIVDNYFALLESLGDMIETVEEDLVSNPSPDVLKVIHDSKRDLIYLRKSVWPLREVISSLERGESKLIKKPTRIFLRDVYDHTIQVMDAVETLRDMVSGMLDIYLSVVSNKMNEVMKVLTIIATIFIPLTFIAGIYGMNFANMPELGWQWGYLFVLLSMLIIGLLMTWHFRRRQWL